MLSKYLCSLLLLFAFVLAGCDSRSAGQLTSAEPPAAQADGAVARLHFDLGPVGVVAGRSMAGPSKRILIRFQEICGGDAVGRSRYDTLLFRGGQELSEEYRFEAGTRWKVYASVDDNFWTLYRGEAEFAVESRQTIDVQLDMHAMYSVGRFRVPVIDSMTKIVLRIDGTVKIDCDIPKQTRVGEVLEFDVDQIPASPTGAFSTFDVIVAGEMWGRFVTLYRMTDTIRLVSGVSMSLPLALSWVGPTSPPASGANLLLSFETPIVVDAELYYNDTTGARAGTLNFMDSRTGEVYPYKRIGSQTWMLRNIGKECFDVPDSVFGSTDDCKYGTLFTDTAAVIDTKMLEYAPIPARDFRQTCPAGWHVPDTSEWKELVRFAAGGETDSVGAYRLRTRVGWYGKLNALGIPYAQVTFNGSDELGFALHPTLLYRNGYTNFTWNEAQLFTSTPGCRVVIFDNHGFKGCSDFHFEKFYPFNTYAASVRCIKDSL